MSLCEVLELLQEHEVIFMFQQTHKHLRFVVCSFVCKMFESAFAVAEESHGEAPVKQERQIGRQQGFEYTPVMLSCVDTGRPSPQLYLLTWPCLKILAVLLQCGGHMFTLCSRVIFFPHTVQTRTGHMNCRLCVSNPITSCYFFKVFFYRSQLHE